MSSSEAGPSTSAAVQVPLSVEPVHIYTDSNPSSSAVHGIVSAFDRERSLQDILPDGTNVFAQPKPASVQLSEDVRRLWSERGDFSLFRSSDLIKKRQRSSSASSSSSSDDEDGEGAAKRGEEEEEEGLLRRPREANVGGTIGESEFVKLRNKVLQNLDVAHFNSIHAHQLLGMLIKQYRSSNSSSSGLGGGGGQAGRMASPAPSVGAQSNKSGSTSVPNPVQKAPLGIFTHLTHPSNREEEFILDPLSIALSRTSLASTAARRDLSAEEEEEEDGEEYEDRNSSTYGIKQAKRELESTIGFKENKLREFKIVLETKRKAISNAAELLSSAGEELRRSQGANRERWRALIGLQGRGWGLTPGRPLLDVERFGVSTEEEGGEGKEEKKKKNGAAGLQGFGTPIVTSDGKVKEEGARDAWIGFGIPEAPIELKRRSLAYWADTTHLPSSSTNPAAGGLRVEQVKQKLVFPDRMHRRLRVRFVLWPSSTAPHGDVDKMQWSSDASPPSSSSLSNSANKGKGIIMGQILDSELQAASREASDELIFGDVVAQARLLPPSFGVRLTQSSVRIVLTKRLDLVVELVLTTTNTDSDSDEEKKAEGEKGKGEVKYSPHASLLLAFLRLGPLRKYMAFVAATKEGRKSDAAARASAIKAVALAVPKKSNASNTGVGARGDGGGKIGGIAAGGKATSTALAKLDSLGPVLVGLHYWSFVYRLGSLLQGLQDKLWREKDIKLRVQLVPITPSFTVSALGRVGDLSSSLARTVDAVPSQPLSTASTRDGRRGGEGSLHSTYTSTTPRGKQDVLKGYAKVYIDQAASQRLVCTLSFAQPSLLSVQFAPGNKVGGGVNLTNKPLSVDLDTLGTLLSQYIC